MTHEADRDLVEVRVPTLATPGDDAVLTAWYRDPGEPVAAGELLADLETDKVVLEVASPVDGIVAELLVPAGGEVGEGAVLARVAAPSAEEHIRVPSAAVATGPPPTAPSAEPGVRRTAMTPIRRRIGENLLRAHTTQALVTTVNEVDMTVVRQLRDRYNARLRTAGRTGLSYLPFFVKAVIGALRRFPVVNAVIEGQDIVSRDSYHIGVAVATDRGLIVPVVRDADRKSFTELESEIGALASCARSGRISLADVAGGTFTITNGGVYGSLLSTPIVGPGQSAILGMHAIQDRAVVIDGKVAVRPMMYLALTYDHRLVDGSEAVQFLGLVKQSLEQARLLLAGR